MKKLTMIFIFIFLTGLFAGLFFSMNLSEENSEILSAELISGLNEPAAGFFRTTGASLLSNLIPVLFMLPAAVCRYFCFLPPLTLWFRSFATGFCCGLLFLNADSRAFILSAIKILPQNLFLIPGFLLMAVLFFYCSGSGCIRKSRPSAERKNLLHILIISLILIFTGSIVQGISHSIAL